MLSIKVSFFLHFWIKIDNTQRKWFDVNVIFCDLIVEKASVCKVYDTLYCSVSLTRIDSIELSESLSFEMVVCVYFRWILLTISMACHCSTLAKAIECDFTVVVRKAIQTHVIFDDMTFM